MLFVITTILRCMSWKLYFCYFTETWCAFIRINDRLHTLHSVAVISTTIYYLLNNLLKEWQHVLKIVLKVKRSKERCVTDFVGGFLIPNVVICSWIPLPFLKIWKYYLIYYPRYIILKKKQTSSKKE